MKSLDGIRGRDMARLRMAAAARQGGLLDMAIVAVAHDAMLRASEIPSVTWQDVSYLPDGGAQLAIPGDDGTHIRQRPLSPETVVILAELLHAEENPAPTQQLCRLTTSQITRRIRALCRAAGMAGEYAASSPRIGQAQDLAEADWTVEAITDYGRWKTLDSAWHYVQRSRHYHRLRALQPARDA